MFCCNIYYFLEIKLSLSFLGLFIKQEFALDNEADYRTEFVTFILFEKI